MGWLSSPSPDKNIGKAALESAELSREALQWFKDEYAATKDERDATTALTTEVANAQLEGMQYATQQAKDLDARNKTVFQPMEDQIVKEANEFDTAGRRVQAANEATADVESAFGSAQDGLNRTLARSGFTPGSGRSMSLMQDAALKKATAVAGATTGAVKNVEQQGYARKMDAVGLGKGIVGNQATMQQIAQQGGAQATNASNAALQASMSGAGMMGQGFGTAIGAMGQAGNLYGQAAAAGNAGGGGAALGALGGVLGSYAGSSSGSALLTKGLTSLMAMSDEAKKRKTGKPADTATMLEQIENTPVEEGWEYDPAKGGVADGGRPHDGPMAQSVRKTMGDKAAPGGKAIDLVTMNGRLMGGMQELAKRVDAIEEGSMQGVVRKRRQKEAA